MASEEDDPDIAIDRCPTKPLEPREHPTGAMGKLDRLRMTLDLADPEAVANFLEAVAASIRERRRIVLVIE